MISRIAIPPLVRIGHQDDGDGGLLELRNCCGCRLTVSREVTRAEAIATGCACALCAAERVSKSQDHPRWCECVGCEFRATRRRRLIRQARVRAVRAQASRGAA